MGHKRWYDQDVQLGEVVRAMEFMNLQTRHTFAAKLLELSEELLERLGGEQYLQELEPEKKQALTKAQTIRRRWYDQCEDLHQAFNNLYALGPAHRREVARKLQTPIMLVGAYEKYCAREHYKPVPRIIQEILWTSLLENDGEARAKKLYSFYLHDHTTYTGVSARGSSKYEEPDGMWSTLLSSLQSALTPA